MKKSIILLCIVGVLFLSYFVCGYINDRTMAEKEYLKFYYSEKGIETMCAITNPEDVKKSSMVVDTTFYDSITIYNFLRRVINLKNDTLHNNYVDLRVVAEFHLKDSNIIISFGENTGTMIGNVRKIDDPVLFNFIEKNLYSKQGWRRLFDASIRKRDDYSSLTKDQIEKGWNGYYSWVKKQYGTARTRCSATR